MTTGDAGRPVKTLYDEIQGTYAPVSREEVMHSMIVVTKFGPHINDKVLVSNFLLNLLPQVTRPYNVTGMILTYPKHAVLILEAPIKSLLSVLRGLNDSECLLKKAIKDYYEVSVIPKVDDEETPVEISDEEIIRKMIRNPEAYPIIQSRILCILHDCKFRIFKAFELKIFDMEATPLPELADPNEDEKKLIELLQQLTRLSVYLVSSAMKDQEEYVPEIYKMRMTKLLNDLREEHPELVPQQTDLSYFAEVSTLEGLMSVPEYLERFEKPCDGMLVREATWPIPKNYFMYH
uniref:Uncharacterized protein n=1 Tax=Schistocephalus solidus TaxID=70667 RepID=A0A0X3NWM5_SCHSO